ncbi:hypothetical protein CDCA_CDCA02G0513 [Cyanidium caldarium]|uniref:N-acetyltransferase domain-containing protein n=1 Tax=Cyanidium caldarium TaxID=2771 RepID=A0AAV9IR39_CYACA|nr:hypothetical protein CDCA_CDCA02G0513 [Cyanidium caldarium]
MHQRPLTFFPLAPLPRRQTDTRTQQRLGFSGWRSAIELRGGQPRDGWFIARSVLSEGMNPLGLQPQRFLVACDRDEAAGVLRPVGFGQLRPLSKDALELASMYVLPQYRRRGIASTIIRALLDRETQRLASVPPEQGRRVVFCLTVGSERLYKRHGFVELDPFAAPGDADTVRVPQCLRFEILAGRVVAGILRPGEPLSLLCCRLG